MGVPLCVTCCFSLVVFSIFALSLIFINLITMCLPMCVPLWVYLSWDSQHFGELSNCFLSHTRKVLGTSQVALVAKNQRASAEDARDVGLIPGSRRSYGVRNGNPLQYSCLENSMDRGAWQAIVHGVAKSWTWLRDWAHTGKFSAIVSSNTFLGLFSLSPPSMTYTMQMLVH